MHIRTSLPRPSLAAVAYALLVFSFASPAAAVTLADISPLYFDDVAFGFDPSAINAAGLTADLVAVAGQDDFMAAGEPASGALVQITSQVVSMIHQNPAVKSRANPAIIDSTWTIKNMTASALSAPLLMFTSLDPNDSYPGNPDIGLDAGPLRLLLFDNGGPEIFYGVAQLPDLAVGESTQITVRYVVASGLQQVQDPTQLIAPLGLYLAVTYSNVPEPSTLSLALGGLMLIALAGRKKTARRGAA